MSVCLRKPTQSLIKSIKLYLQEIHVIHSEEKHLKAHSDIMYSKELKGSFCFNVLYTEHATCVSSSHDYVGRQGALRRQ